MLAKNNDFKKPPKKYQPKGLSVIYEDRDIIVIDKMTGLLTVGNERERENTAYYRLNNYVRKGNQKSRNRVFIVHRLDRETSGILVFAKSEQAKKFLQGEWENFDKKYLAVVKGKLQKPEDTITSYLTENKVHKMYSTDNKEQGKLAKTWYKVIDESLKRSLVEIKLLTGRKNQIRAHFSEMGNYVIGDSKYGEKEKGVKRLALHASELTIVHPYSKEKMTFKTKKPLYFKELMR